MSGPEPRLRTARRTTAALLHTATAVMTALVLSGVVRVVLWLVDLIWSGLVGP
ncbi:hypothetical protein [Nocardiopsis ganjiahuensis]|uniref:hypothetical protein n=1 Tax=Nocardiopsis ganjiahuensis TaxID=239984 RepID=UPI00034CB5AD|nr:hypothetical protein [Nocardiopsis ganjiahuensis]